MATLYIIGNGFDLHHGLPTRYSHFKDWLSKRDPDSVELIESLYGNEDFPCWRDFEAVLGQPNVWAFDAWHGALTKEFLSIMFVYDPISLFRDWVVSLLRDPSFPCKKDVSLADQFCRNDVFLSFNYTPTLEMVYDIDPKRVCHIHGESALTLFGERKDNLIVGHAEKCDPPVPIWGGRKDEDLLHIYEETAKPSAKLIRDVLQPFVKENVFRIQKVVVMGSSLSDADLPYFSFLIKHLVAEEWFIYCVNDSDKAEKERFAENYLGPKEIKAAFLSW